MVFEINSTEFQNVNLLILHPILMHFFWQNEYLYGSLMNQKNVLLFYFKRGPNWKAYLTLEIVKQNKYPKDNGSSILLCQAKSVFTQMFNFPLSTCCSHTMLCSAILPLLILLLKLSLERKYEKIFSL